ncbi:MAG: discoidin domain-containing protein [Chloroflexota bacterium]
MKAKILLRLGLTALLLAIFVQLVMFTPDHARAIAPGLNVQGRFLYDKHGDKIILYGINRMIYWTDIDGVPSYQEIAKTGANSVRIQWLTTGTASQLDTAITNCRANRMIPMVELHDATGDWSKLPSLVDYWTRSDIVAVLQKHQEYLLVNIGNEVGQNVSQADFLAGYTTAVTRMRNAGIHVPLVIDGAGWGKDIDILQATGPTLIQNDPDHNLMFSVHMWWPYMWGFTDQRVIDEIAQSVNMNLPLMIGEFGHQWDTSSGGKIPYKLIIQQAHLNEIGYFPWSWGPGNTPQTFLDMTTDGTYNTLHGWGLEVAVTDPHSIKNIAVRPAWLEAVEPSPTPTQVPPNLVSFNKPVTVSSTEANSTNFGPNAVDGSLGSRWASQYSDPQWIYVDLGSTYSIGTVELIWEAAYARQYKIQLSDNATTWTDVFTEYNGNGGTDTISVNQSGRYVRMYGTQRATSYGYSLWEFSVYSSGPTHTPTATSTDGPTNTPTSTSTDGPTPTASHTPTPTATTSLTATPTASPTRTLTATPSATPTFGPCGPANAVLITAPFVSDGAGTFCWKASNLGTFINSWNLAGLTINGANYRNVYAFTNTLPAKLDGYWYISYTGLYPWSHFEAK